jgi:acetoacetyl-CoA synthetase
LQQRAKSSANADAASPAPASHANAQTDNPAMAQLAAIWAELLGKSSIAPDDNFFDLGGHSLTAAQMLHRAKVRFGRMLPLAMLVERPTIRLIVEWLAIPASDEPTRVLPEAFVTLKATGNGLPLYFLPRPEPTPMTYLPLARLLDCDRPAFAVLDPNDTPSAPLDASVAQIGARFAALLCQRQPEGDFLLCGHSHSGVLAYEVAGQLHAAGRRVELLALLDSRVPGARRFIPEKQSALQRSRRWFSKTILAGLARRLRRGLVGDPPAPPIDDEAPRPGLDPALAARHEAVKNLFRMYRPPPYAGSITLFRAMTPPNNPRFELPGPTNGWNAFCDQIEVLPITCDHNEMMREPHLSLLAQAMSERLRQIAPRR